MHILLMIRLLHEFLIVSCVLCAPQVDGSLYQLKHCLGIKYSMKRVTNIERGEAKCYISSRDHSFTCYQLNTV